MSFNQLIVILKARWLVLLSILALTVITTALVTLALPKRYTASATVLVDIKSPDPVVGAVLPGIMSPTYMATQVDLLSSERVGRKVVSQLGLVEDPVWRANWLKATKGQGDAAAWMADTVMASIKVTPSRESNVIRVDYVNNDPIKAAEFANAFVDAFISVTSDLRVEPAKQFGSSFSELSTQLRKRLESAQSRLSDFQRKSGLMATDERMDVETARLNDLSTLVMQLQSMTSDMDIRMASARSKGADLTTDALSSPLIGSLKADLIKEESRMDQLQQRLGDAHPSVQEQRAAVSAARNKLQNEYSRVTNAMGANGSIGSLRLKDATASLEAQRNKLMTLKEQRNTAAVLIRDVENLQRAYDAVESRVSQATMEAKATQTNLAVIQSAAVPASPSFPKFTLNVAMAIVLGLLVGAGTVVSIEMIDRRVRSNEDISKDLQLPVLGVMLKTPNASRGLLTRRTAPWIIDRTLPAPAPTA